MHRKTEYSDRVALPYQLYSALFSTLPYGDLAVSSSQLLLFTKECERLLYQEESPTAVVERFCSHLPLEKRHDLLFQFLQIVERQVVLFDAIEDAAFPHLHSRYDRGTLKSLLQRVDEAELHSSYGHHLKKYAVRMVLTAHPTQFYPEPVLGIIRELITALQEKDLHAIRQFLLQLGRTPFRNRRKPTPRMEAHAVLWYLENNFYDVIPAIWEEAVRAVPEDLDPEQLAGMLEIGFWPGGDRDGNPYVTAETTREVARTLKESILSRYIHDMERLLKRLTFDGVFEGLQVCLNKIIQTRDAHTTQGESAGYASPQELCSDLQEIRQCLQDDHQGLFIQHIDTFITRVRIFGFHFAILDLRQDSSVHHEVCTEILHTLDRQGVFPSHLKEVWDQNGATADFLRQLLETPLSLEEISMDTLSVIARETLDSYRAVWDIQRQNGPRSIHRSIISNTQSACHVLEVFVLIHLSGGSLETSGLDIVPLFETIDDLTRADAVMKELYETPVYRAHLQRRGGVQHIMVGFSDGTKDGGYLGANLGIYQAKRRLTAVSREADISLVFFDGRGGPPARGGGNTHRFYRSLGHDVSHDHLHLTVQGQTISSNFGTRDSARYNIEQLFTAGLESSLFYAEEGVLSAKEAALLDELSQQAHEKYLALREDPLFIPYLEEMTPLRFYDRLNVGSRPVKRKGNTRKFSDLRAIPFVGSWSQIKQNVPGFYGLGTALESLRDTPGKWEAVQQLYVDNLFFQTLIDNAMQSLAKTCFPLTASLQNHPRYGGFWKILEEEAKLTERLLCEVAGISCLLEKEPVIRASIKIREKIVLPLLVIQQYALEELQRCDEPEEREILEKLVVKSLAANINASRNSA
ncbi:phosphoenolpyruvate carboxylase [Chitinivibrio alkaliphilus]|uniref:Phosphoenolpyruvate carboxylase n=1 Tax=Chitinivibrio alkaliphilus ACht1 TaxID=1313304 RepID=U7DCD3_9BACT|nr:phosphoenolpyruvate carboxylase [Chitinivibrio alkaliphilus]ERP39233.1 phosphoenolpyruvate carboxylase [Chitinivibrio alkaliphilus ACht1]